MRPETDIASEEYEDLLTRVESVEKITSGMNIGGNVDLGNVFARGLITGIFRSGDGIKDVDLDGFQMDGDELVGQASGVDQIVLSGSTGALTAGAGAVTLDADGLWFDSGGAKRIIEWRDGGGAKRCQVAGWATDDVEDAHIRLTLYEDDGSTLAARLALDKSLGIIYVETLPFRLATAQQPIQFVDSNTEIWEDASSNLSFKDANAGTITLKQLYGQKVVMGAPTELTIASGVITATQSNHIVDTESDDATDDLDTINGGVDGMILTLSTVASTRDVVVKNNTGNIRCGADFTLGTLADSITFKYDATSSKWRCIGKENN